MWSEDGVKVYDGGDIESPVIAHLCGVIHHAELWSSSSSLLVEFYSSNSSEHTFEGFEGRYSFLPAARGADEYDDIIEEEDEDEEDEENEDGFIINPPGVTSSTTWTTPTTSVGTTATTRRRTRKTFLHALSFLPVTFRKDSITINSFCLALFVLFCFFIYLCVLI